LTGGQFAEELMIGPGSASFRGGWFEVAVTGLERTTANGNGGLDTWTFTDTAGRDVVNSRPGNTLVLGAGYDHRAYGFESTTLVASGGTDRITLIGSVGDDWLQSGVGSFTFVTANGFTTTGAGFAETLFQGGGGSDRTEIVGSSGRDEFYYSPELAFLSTLNFSGTWQGFKQHLLDGRGGGDAATLLDSVLDDRLTLRRASTVLGNSAGRSIELSNFGTLRAISTVDSGRDVVTYIERDLDYAFETIGDWIEE
jgi:hypothetical protein